MFSHQKFTFSHDAKSLQEGRKIKTQMQYFLKFNFKIRSPSSLDNLNCKRKIDNLRDICTKREKNFCKHESKAHNI